jgi:hypothetical protein
LEVNASIDPKWQRTRTMGRALGIHHLTIQTRSDGTILTC